MGRFRIVRRGLVAAAVGGGGGTFTPTITSLLQLQNFLSGAAPGSVGYVTGGFDFGSVDMSGSPRKVGSNPIKVVTANPASKYKFSSTNDASALNMTNWGGVTFDGVEFYNPETGIAGANYTLANFTTTSYITVRNAYTHGAVLPHNTHHNIGYAMAFDGSDHVLVERSKITGSRDIGLYLGGVTYSNMLDNFFTDNNSDSMRPDGRVGGLGAHDINFRRNLEYNPQPQVTFGGNPVYADHSDFVQVYTNVALGQVYNLLFDSNMVCCDTDYARGQGLFIGNESSGVPGQPGVDNTVIHDLTITNNIFMGMLYPAIQLNGCAGTNLVSGNQIFGQDQASGAAGYGTYPEGGSPDTRYTYFGSLVTHTNNDGHIVDSGYNTITQGAGNANTTQSTIITKAQMATKMAAFRTANPNIPN